jgi:hypothetical protein
VHCPVLSKTERTEKFDSATQCLAFLCEHQREEVRRAVICLNESDPSVTERLRVLEDEKNGTDESFRPDEDLDAFDMIRAFASTVLGESSFGPKEQKAEMLTPTRPTVDAAAAVSTYEAMETDPVPLRSRTCAKENGCQAIGLDSCGLLPSTTSWRHGFGDEADNFALASTGHHDEDVGHDPSCVGRSDDDLPILFRLLGISGSNADAKIDQSSVTSTVQMGRRGENDSEGGAADATIALAPGTTNVPATADTMSPVFPSPPPSPPPPSPENSMDWNDELAARHVLSAHALPDAEGKVVMPTDGSKKPWRKSVGASQLWGLAQDMGLEDEFVRDSNRIPVPKPGSNVADLGKLIAKSLESRQGQLEKLKLRKKAVRAAARKKEKAAAEADSTAADVGSAVAGTRGKASLKRRRRAAADLPSQFPERQLRSGRILPPPPRGSPKALTRQG